jgi:hypothetical protein
MTYHQISMLLGIGKATAWLYVHQCTYAICKHMYAMYIRFPTPAEARKSMLVLQQQSGIPGIFGAIDGTHININKPIEDGQDYFNRKSFYSINVQGMNLHKFS